MKKNKKIKSGLKALNSSCQALSVDYYKKQAVKALEKAKALECEAVKTKRWILLPDGKTRVLR